MELRCLFLLLLIFSVGFSYKDKTHDVEQLLNSGELKFNKSDSTQIVSLFGRNFNFKTSWRHARMAGGGDWNWSYQYYQYKKAGVEFELTKFMDSDKPYDTIPSFHLSRVKLSSHYKLPVLTTIKVGKTTFDELRKEYTLDEVVYKQDRSLKKVYVEQEFENYTFSITLKILLNEKMSREQVISYLSEIIATKAIEEITIVRKRSY